MFVSVNNLVGMAVSYRNGFIIGYRTRMVGSAPEREVYPNAPVVFVALEVRHPASEPLTQGERALLKRSVAKNLPVLRMAQQMVITGQVGSNEAPTVRQEVFPKLFNRSQTIAASIKDDAIILESTDYKHFEEFRDLAAAVMGERNRISPIDGVERIGLRYIDEIRVPQADNLKWSEWVDPRLVGPEDLATDLGFRSADSQGVLAMEVAPAQNLVLRFGPRQGFAVDPNGDLRRPAVTSGGEFFLCDIDSFWLPIGETPEFSTESVVAICDDLHAPVRRVFESIVTEKLRNEVFRNG